MDVFFILGEALQSKGEQRIGGGKREGRGKKIQISNPIYISLCLNATLLRGMKSRGQRRGLIEAQRKHANAMILFSLPALLGPSLIIQFHFLFFLHASDRYSLTFTTRVSVC